MDEQEKLKQIPLIVMLTAAAVTAVISLFSEITFGVFLLRIFIASVSFYVIGSVAQILFTYGLKTYDEKDGKDKDDEKSGSSSDEGEEPETSEDEDGFDEDEDRDEGF